MDGVGGEMVGAAGVGVEIGADVLEATAEVEVEGEVEAEVEVEVEVESEIGMVARGGSEVRTLSSA